MLSSAKKIILALAFFSLFTACSQEKNSLNKFYGADANYFNGLLALRDKKTETAQKYFFRSAKKEAIGRRESL